jgi:hypothetical protein
MRWLIIAGLFMVMLRSEPQAFAKSKERPVQQTAGYISDVDYPSSAIRNGESGTVTAKFIVGKNGVVKDCVAEGLERSTALMTQTCNLITRRFRYAPELNKKGKPVEVQKTIRISWRLPDSRSGVDIVPSGMGRDVALRLTVTSEGQVIRCEKDTGYDWADYHIDDICALFIKRYSPRPVKVVNGKPVPQVERALITVRVY